MPVVMLTRLTLRWGNRSRYAASAAATNARRTISSTVAYGRPFWTASSANGAITWRSAAIVASCLFMRASALGRKSSARDDHIAVDSHGLVGLHERPDPGTYFAEVRSAHGGNGSNHEMD